MHDDNYTHEDIEDFRQKFKDFLDANTESPNKWYDKGREADFGISGSALQQFLYSTNGDIFIFKGMKRTTFKRILNSFPDEKLAEEKKDLLRRYNQWESAKKKHRANTNDETQPLSNDESHSSQEKSKLLTLSRYKILIGLLLLLILSAAFIFSQSSNPPIILTENGQWVPQHKVIDGIPMVLAPKGCFTMGYLHGESNEQPVSEVCLEAFWLAETETTIEQYGETPHEVCNTDQLTLENPVNEATPNHPMNCVTWEEAHNFCLARGMRLPTEAEWEYGLRGPSNWLYPWGNTPEPTYTIVRIDPNAPRPVLPVGSMSRDTSWVGAKDMAGNIREFTSTINNISPASHTPFGLPYNADDGRESLENIGTWEDWTGTTRVVKGGNFDEFITRAHGSFRYDEFFDFRFNHYGFRCAVDAD